MIRMHRGLELAIQLLSLFQEGGTLLGLSGGALFGMFFIYAIIKTYNVFPLNLYIFFPCVSIFIVCTFTMIFHMDHQVFDKSTELGRIWPIVWYKSKWSIVVRKQIKEMRNILRSIRPVRLYAGIGSTKLFFVKKSTKITYWSMVITHTINLLLCIPQELVNEFAAFVSSQFD
jgi:hypothetical protein